MISTAACLLLATGVVLFSGPADEGEAIVRRYGRATKRYFPSDSVPPVDKIAIELDVEGQPADNGVYRDLVHLGWVRLPGASMAVLQPASRSSGSRAVFPTLKGKVHVVYVRPANAGERFLYRLRSAVGISDVNRDQ
jgi:hypothetical protein